MTPQAKRDDRSRLLSRWLAAVAAVAAIAIAAPAMVVNSQGSTTGSQAVRAEMQQITNEANAQLANAVAAAARCDLEALAAARRRLNELLQRARQILAEASRSTIGATPDAVGSISFVNAEQASNLVRFVEAAVNQARVLRPACPQGQSEWDRIGSDPKKSGGAPGLSSDRFSQWLDEMKELDRRHAEAARRCDREEMARILAEMDSILRVMADVAWSPGYRAVADDPGAWGDSVRAVRSMYAFAQSIRQNAAARKPECPEPVEDLIEQQGSGTVMPDEAAPGAPDQPPGSPPAPPGDAERQKQGSTVPAPPGSGSPASHTMNGAQQQENRQNQPAEAPARWPPTRDWPSKTAPSELKAKNSETFVEPMEGPSSAMEICEEAGSPDAECAAPQPPQRKARPRERRKPR
jgi:ElaB/YqjD/DUF883 family membrane-anchored ribosome-binding protein